MCRKISSDVIIGNYLIEALNNSVTELQYSDFMELEAKLNFELTQQSMDYYSDIFFNDIYETISMFSCFTITDTSINISIEGSQKPKLLEKLIEFFRYGLPAFIETVILSACTALLVPA